MHHNEEEPSLATNRESLHIAVRTQHHQKLIHELNFLKKVLLFLVKGLI